MIYCTTLKNGIRVIVNKLDGVFSVSMGILVGAGSAIETPEENGISHFIEHVNFKGTEKRSAFELNNDVDKLGSQINAFTSKDYTCFYIKSTMEHIAESFEILSDLFVNPVYDSEELDRERGVILEEINMYDDTPDDLCAELLAGAYFGEGGYGAAILGTKERVSSFSKADIIAYKNKYYTTDNIVVSASGGVDEKEFFELCEKYLGGIKTSKMAKAPERNTSNLCKSVSRCKDIEQVHLALGFPGLSVTDKDGDAFSIIINVLGGGMSSRLFQSVRENLGLCYSVYSYMSSYADCGYSLVYAGVNKASVMPAYDAIIKEMQLLKTDKITEEEFLRCREQMKSSLIFAQESVISQMLLYGKRLLKLGDVFDFSKRLDEINLLTKDDVNGLIDRHFDISNLAKSIVGKDVKPL